MDDGDADKDNDDDNSGDEDGGHADDDTLVM